MKNIIKWKEGEQSWVGWIKKRIDNNLNFLCLGEGATGSGKSWGMLSIAHDIDPEFEVKQVAFSFKEVMSIINSDWFKKKKWKIIIFDEAQIDISNRAWQSLMNKLFNYLLSTFRNQNIILFFTSPYSDFLDSQSMKLIHAKFEVRGHSKKTKKTTIRPKLLQYNSKLKKFYEHSLFVLRNKRMEKLVKWYVNKPPQHLIEPYEKAKREFTDKLNKSIARELENLENKDENKKELNPDTMQPDIWEIAKQGYKWQKDIANKLSEKYGRKIYAEKVCNHVKVMRNKGWDIKQFQIKEK